MKRKAFTLIELLVVISIISLLIAILLPALANARKAAYGSMCLTNQRQIGISHEYYQEDYDRYFVPWHQLSGADGYWSGIFLHNGYSSNALMFRCPDFPDAYDLNFSTLGVASVTSSRNRLIHYGYNWTYLGSSYGLPGLGTTSMSARDMDIAQPSETLLTVDAIGQRLNGPLANSIAGSWIADPWHNTFTPNTTNFKAAHARHLGAVTAQFVDGHAQKIMGTSDPLNPYAGELTDRFANPNDNLWDRK